MYSSVPVPPGPGKRSQPPLAPVRRPRPVTPTLFAFAASPFPKAVPGNVAMPGLLEEVYVSELHGNSRVVAGASLPGAGGFRCKTGVRFEKFAFDDAQGPTRRVAFANGKRNMAEEGGSRTHRTRLTRPNGFEVRAGHRTRSTSTARRRSASRFRLVADAAPRASDAHFTPLPPLRVALRFSKRGS